MTVTKELLNKMVDMEPSWYMKTRDSMLDTVSLFAAQDLLIGLPLNLVTVAACVAVLDWGRGRDLAVTALEPDHVERAREIARSGNAVKLANAMVDEVTRGVAAGLPPITMIRAATVTVLEMVALNPALAHYADRHGPVPLTTTRQ